MSTEADNELVIVRVLDAPRAQVWRACTEVAALKQWWGLPAGATMPTCKLDLRVGGAMLCEIEHGGTRLWFKWTFLEIVEGERLVMRQHISDADGRELVSPERPVSTVRLSLEDLNGKTRLTVTQTGMASPAHRIADFREGWSQSLHRLDAHLAATVQP
jgi:uncharacterized protein YndB with AHSA1/START domain